MYKNTKLLKYTENYYKMQIRKFIQNS